jgi:hypothetical protein
MQTTTSPSPHSQTSFQEPYVATNQPATIIKNGLTMQHGNNRRHSDMRTIIDENVPLNHMMFEPPPTINFCLPIEAAPPHHDTKQDNCSTLALHLYFHVKCMRFNTKAEVPEWCQSNIGVDIIWQSNPITLMNTASTKLCHLCAAERLVIDHNFNHLHQRKKIINLKN